MLLFAAVAVCFCLCVLLLLFACVAVCFCCCFLVLCAAAAVACTVLAATVLAVVFVLLLCLERVCVLTFDGRLFMGTLTAFDQSTNIVLNKCTEKVVHEDAPVEIIPLGLYLLRGDNMYEFIPLLLLLLRLLLLLLLLLLSLLLQLLLLLLLLLLVFLAAAAAAVALFSSALYIPEFVFLSILFILFYFILFICSHSAVVGQVDEDVEKSIDASGVRAPPLKQVSLQRLCIVSFDYPLNHFTL